MASAAAHGPADIGHASLDHRISAIRSVGAPFARAS
jgi:hypothetical protein